LYVVHLVFVNLVENIAFLYFRHPADEIGSVK